MFSETRITSGRSAEKPPGSRAQANFCPSSLRAEARDRRRRRALERLINELPDAAGEGDRARRQASRRVERDLAKARRDGQSKDILAPFDLGFEQTHLEIEHRADLGRREDVAL